MKALWVLAVVFGVGGVVHARPAILEEASTITLPDPSYYLFGWQVALDGEFAIGIGYKELPNEFEPLEGATLRSAFLFRRVNGQWTFVRILGSHTEYPGRDGVASHGVDMRHGIAVLSFGNSPLIYERVGDDYVQSPVENAFYDRGDDVYVDPDLDRIILGGDCWGATLVDKDPDGVWRGKDGIRGDFCGSTDGASGGPVALFGNQAVVSNPYNDDGLPGPAVTTFVTTNGTDWTEEARIVVPEGHDAHEVAIGRPLPDGRDRLLVEDDHRFGTAIYLRDGAGEWQRSDTEFLRSAGDWMGWRVCMSCTPHGGSVEVGEGFLLRHAYDADGDRRVVHVYTRHQDSAWIHAATLEASDGDLWGRLAISGRNVLVSGPDKAYYFELPATFPQPPPVLQDTFAGSTAPGWTQQSGSSFTVAQGTGSRVFRQSTLTGEAGAVLDASLGTDQAIQADVRPTAIDGADRWVGLVTRRADAANYYYVTLRSSGIIALKRMYQGQWATLDSALAPFTLNRNYRLRLESIGTTHRVYVDGVKVLEAEDEFLAQGRAGLLMYRAAADFDNVVVSPGQQTTIWRESGGGTPVNPEPWTYHGGQWAWNYEGSWLYFKQGSIADWSRAFAGPVLFDTDQVVEARARVRAFGSGSDPWFGVVAGARDADTYTYLALRRSNTITLRKVDGATVTQLAQVPFTVTPGAWYRLRLDTIGNQVRGYVNGRLVIEATDAAPTAGQAGLVTYRTQADFDDFNAVVP